MQPAFRTEPLFFNHYLIIIPKSQNNNKHLKLWQKKKDNNFIDELSKLLDGKLEGLLDTLDLSDMPEEELTNLLMSTISNPVDTMKMFADEYYSYDAPDYASMVRPVPGPFQPLLHLMVEDLPVVEKMRNVCAQFDEQTLSNELLNVNYVW